MADNQSLLDLLNQANPPKVTPDVPFSTLLPEGSKQFAPRPPEVWLPSAQMPMPNKYEGQPGILGATVGKIPTTPMSFTPPAAPAVPQPTKTIATEPTRTPAGVQTGEQPTPPTGLQEVAKDEQKAYTELGTYNYKGALEDQAAAQTEFVNKMTEFQKEIVDDKEIQAAWKKYVGATANVEDLLDPTSEGSVAFKNNLKMTADSVLNARKDLEDFQKNYKIDPQRYWKETPFLDHAMNAVAILMEGNVAAAAVRAGMPAPTGLVQQRIDKAIQEDIARQKEEFKMGEASRENTINRFRDNYKLLGDERAAELKSYADLATQAALRVDALKQSPYYQNKANALKIDELNLKLQGDAARNMAEANKVQIQMNTKSAIPKPAEGMSPEERRKDRELNVGVLGIPMRARSLDDAKTLKEKGAASEQAIASLKALEQLRNEAGVLDLAKLPTNKMAKARTLISNLHMAMKQSFALGALDKGSLEFLQGAVPAPDQWTDALDKYSAMRKAMTLGYTTELNQRVEGADFSPKAVDKAIQNYDAQRGFTKYLLED